ncbi:MAG: ferritin family protein [Halobacteria archaeon]|nr:ferritin family protein [Halobacteria archaeon]
MDSETLVDEVRGSKSTELDRLRSSKSLLATTKGNLNSDDILKATANSEYSAYKTFERWAETEEREGMKQVFKEVAEEERDHFNRVSERLDEDFEPDEPVGPIHEYLRDLENTHERVGAGMIGRTLVSDATLSQTIAFYIGKADTKKTDFFRDLREETEEMLEEGKGVLDEVCQTDEDWERAREGAEKVIGVAYDDVETLEGMGVNPKPVC